MKCGIKVYDASGVEVLDASDNLTGIAEVFTTGTQDGKKVLAQTNYRIWYCIINVIGYDANNLHTQYEIPIITLSNNVLSWKFTQSYNRCSLKLAVGFY